MDSSQHKAPNVSNKVKISVSIIGDAFADLFCYLDNCMPSYGGDVRVNRPVTAVPGGSGLNTATHLRSLIDYFDDGHDENMDVTLQTVLNDSDEYGRLLNEHAINHGFQLINCFDDGSKREDLQYLNTNTGSDDYSVTGISDKNSGDEDDNDEDDNSKNNNKDRDVTEQNKPPKQSESNATGHCIVIVNQGRERSFMTHLGVMASFKASSTILHELVNCRSADPTFTNHHHHIHIAGYYNLPGFWNGKMKRRLGVVREKRRNRSHGSNVYTTTTSLVPQYDASEEWDGGLVNLLPMIDFLILNVLEAGKICGISVDDKEGGTALNRAVIFLQMARKFSSMSPSTYVIITLGKGGAVALFRGEILINADCPESVDAPLDPTGAGDAFAAGFLKGIMKWREERMYYECTEIGSEAGSGFDGSGNGSSSGNDGGKRNLAGSWTNAVIQGMSWGCAMGSAVVMQWGASTPPSKALLEKYMKIDQGDEADKSGENVEDINAGYTSDDTYENEDDMTDLPRPVVFCGPSGERKDKLIKMIEQEFGKDRFGSMLIHTTRGPRDDEEDGVHFRFTDVKTMEKDIKDGKYIEHAILNGDYYGTCVDSVKSVQKEGKICVIDVDTEGIETLKEEGKICVIDAEIEGIQSIEHSSLNPFYAFIAPPSTESLEFKLSLHSEDTEEDTPKSNGIIDKVAIEDGNGIERYAKNVFVNDEIGAIFPTLVSQFKQWYPELTQE